ncbi:MAG TPA: hypothetical protein VGL77_15625 [Armatimonadota bacterium]
MLYRIVCCVWCGLCLGAIVWAQGVQHPAVIQRQGWSFDQSVLEWYTWAKPDEEKQKGTFHNLCGWTEYTFDIPQRGWYELWETGNTPEWPRDIFLDGRLLFNLTVSAKDDVLPNGSFKEANLYLKPGVHTLRFRRLGFPGVLPAKWELRAGDGDPASCIAARVVGQNIVRAQSKIKIQCMGGTTQATSYALVVRDEESKELTPVGTVAFPASATPIMQDIDVSFPKQGSYTLLAQVDGKLLRPADLKAGLFIVIDTKNTPAPTKELHRTLVTEIDCVAQAPLREKDGPTTIITAPFGKYRESSGQGTNQYWATDGFSYKFDLPDTNGPYQLEVDYPDNDRRTMGFWVNDQTPGNPPSYPLTGGVDTGDRYRVTNSMQTHQAIFWPLTTKIVFAVVNLNPGMKAAAARVRVYKIDGALDAGPASRPDGRRFGYYFEESPRWPLHFGAQLGKSEAQNNLLTLDRWGQMNRYTGADLMFPTINVYQDNRYPSKILEGYFNATDDQCRMNALFAEKYGNAYIPEFHISGQSWFEKYVMGVWVDEKTKDVKFASPQAEEYVIRNSEGQTHCSWKDFVYNPLHPKVQEIYIAVFGELADNLKDCTSFEGISSRIMPGWQWMGWNVLPGMNWGYDDWTVRQYEQDTGVKVPGEPNDPKRFRQRYIFLTGPQREKWMAWRCQRIFAFHSRLRDRIRQAKPTAKLYFTYYGPDPREAVSSSPLEQMREMGMDPAMYAKASGFVIMPSVSSGRRYSSPVADAACSETIFNDDLKGIAMLGNRGAGHFGNYFEVGDPGWKAYGADNDRFMNDVCMPSGRHELETYAILLADCDCSTLASGAFGYFFGTPSYLRDFLAEYKALPALPFTPLAGGRDPVAVWYRQCPDGFYFYAVNRERYPVTATLTLKNAGRVLSAASGQAMALEGATLKVPLESYQVRAFKATGPASLTGCAVTVPEEEKTLLATQLAFVDQVASGLRDRSLAAELTQAQTDLCVGLIKEARESFTAGRYWKARTNLERPAMVALYDMLGAWPPALQDRKTPRGLVKTVAMPAPALTFAGAPSIIGDVRGKLSSVSDLSCDEQGNLWVVSPEQVMLFDGKGAYQRSLRLHMPYKLDDGSIRGGGVQPPTFLKPVALRALPGGRLAACDANTQLMIYATSSGRVMPLAKGDAFTMPGNVHWQVAADARGNLYIACAEPANAAGVYKYQANGTPDFAFGEIDKTNRLSPIPAAGMAVDASGRVYVSDRNGRRIVIYGADGLQLTELLFTVDDGPRRLAVTPDGQWLFVATGAASLAAFQRDAAGTFAPRWKQAMGGQVSAVALSPANDIVVGFANAVDGAVVRSYKYDVKGISATALRIESQDALYPGVLVGRTPLHEFGGSVYYLSRNRLIRLTPGTPDTTTVVYEPPMPALSFAFDTAGNLYLASSVTQAGKRGEYLWYCQKTATGWGAPVSVSGETPLHTDVNAMIPFDIAVANNNALLFRSMEKGDWPEMRIYGRGGNGALQQLIDMGAGGGSAPWHGYYGLHVDRRTGRIYVAGGPSRAIACLAPDAKLLWKQGFKFAQGPEDLPIRGAQAITTDSKGNVWVADTDENRLLCFTADGQYLSTFGHFGAIDQRDGTAFAAPCGLATVTDAQGQEWLYVADMYNQRIMKYALR